MAQFGDVLVSSVDEELEKYSRKYPFEVLVKNIVPDGVDVVNKEVRWLRECEVCLFSLNLGDSWNMEDITCFKLQYSSVFLC